MSLYPSLEDMKVDQLMKAQAQEPMNYAASQGLASAPANPWAPPAAPYAAPYAPPDLGPYAALYPTLNDEYMGLSLTSAELAFVSQPVAVPAPNQLVAGSGDTMVAPLSANSVGLQRAKVSHGIREVVLCKDKDGKVGMRVQSINKGIFVVLVYQNSPASMVGLRFGDQILQINNENVAGYSRDKVHDMIKKAQINNIHLVVRDRPFERTITLHKDSVGHVGFTFKNGKITALVKDSSAARNGLLTDHNILEVNGQNVVGMEDKGVRSILESGGDVITLTIMPSFIYDHMIKHMATSLIKKFMDHGIPDL